MLPTRPQSRQTVSKVRQREEALVEDAQKHHGHLQEDLGKLNGEQRQAFDAIVQRSECTSVTPKMFFLYASGGCGKTFLLNLLLQYFRCSGKIALASALTGIASLLLKGGATAHSRFGLPLDLDRTASSNLSVQSEKAKVIRDAALVVIDEATMGDHRQFRIVDVLFRDIMATTAPELADVPFGGKLVVLAGDWRQLPPVVRHAGRAGTVSSTLRVSVQWQAFTVLVLKTNMRVAQVGAQSQTGRELAEFAQWLLDVGEGRWNRVKIPASMWVSDMDEAVLVDRIFPQLQQPLPVLDTGEALDNRLFDHVKEACILTTLNKHVDEVNAFVMHQQPGSERVYRSADFFGPADLGDELVYPVEVLNTLSPRGQCMF